MKLLRWTILLLIWGGAMQGAILVGSLSTKWSHVLCGPWGCGPRVEDLLACHLFWLAMLCAPLYLLWHCDAGLCRQAGYVLIGAGSLMLGAVVFYELFTWLPRVDSSLYIYLPQRLFYAVVTFVELPMLQFLLFGFACLYLRKKPSPFDSTETSASETEPN